MSDIIYTPPIISGGNSNPYSLGVNLPTPIVIKNTGNNRFGAPSVFTHGTDFVQNDINALYKFGTLNIYLPNARYSGYNNLGGSVSNNIYDQINKLNPFIFMFVWKRKNAGIGYGGTGHYSHRNGVPIKKGFWSHPPNIQDSQIKSQYSNFGNMGNTVSSPYDWGNNYPSFNDVNTFSINARSEWSLGNTQNVINLQNLNPFRFYSNVSKGNVGSRFFNKDQDFFNASMSFNDFTLSRRRTLQNNIGLANTGKPYYEPRQSDFNIYLAFALVIENPENSKQYIVGPMSNPVKQSLVMGINSSSKKVPKSFKYTV